MIGPVFEPNKEISDARVLRPSGAPVPRLAYQFLALWRRKSRLEQSQRVVLDSNKSFKGQFQSVTDDAIIIIHANIHANGASQTLSRSSVQKVSSHRSGHRGRHALIGAAIGAGAGLGTGAVIDSDCSRQSIVCTGNKGKAILTPVFGLIGAGIGAILPASGWQEVYRSN